MGKHLNNMNRYLGILINIASLSAFKSKMTWISNPPFSNLDKAPSAPAFSDFLDDFYPNVHCEAAGIRLT